MRTDVAAAEFLEHAGVRTKEGMPARAGGFGDDGLPATELSRQLPSESGRT
jgi:hypothetical protein